MKIKHKGKVYPSPSSSSSSSPQTFISSPDALSVLKLLPAAILALASVLSTEDREVLAYMITRSIKTTTTTNPCSFSQDSKKKSKKQPPAAAGGGGGGGSAHKPPVFDCGCFECYTCYWFRWDSSPNRELIHQAIEAFEDHLSSGEKPKRIGGRGKKKERVGRRIADKPDDISCQLEMPVAEEETPEVPNTDDASVAPAPENHAPTARDGCEESKAEDNNGDVPGEESAAETSEIVRDTAASNHKGLARKVLPDVLGLLNSRLWGLWSPNV